MKFERELLNGLYNKFHEEHLKEIDYELQEKSWTNGVSFALKKYYVSIKPDNELFNVYFRPDYSGDLEFFFEIITKDFFAEKIKSLSLSYEDGAANGTMDIDLKNLINKPSNFDRLETFKMSIESSDTNCVLITDNGIFDEGGVCGKLLDKMPNAKKMILLASPSSNFFEREYHPLNTLIVKTIYENNNFIENLANSNCFKNLENLCFYDFDSYNTGEDDEINTTFEHYVKLFNTLSLPNLKVLNILNLSLTDEQIEILKKQTLAKQLKTLVLNKQLFGKDYEKYESKEERYWFLSTHFDNN
ncbi:hypothetical protein EMA8858_04175 [Emticicia aquatica]|uniref:Uncharacterized protein n=1 Tax=Emticicia aquatica TaxID=1681835 RepID=A0ABM9AWQ6_9BACT|nr:hypothetical protein [Emticicia aquatica]CAH0998040.1 hypothetical protein EMA8858_04175 [Emticicia aquatica]